MTLTFVKNRCEYGLYIEQREQRTSLDSLDENFSYIWDNIGI